MSRIIIGLALLVGGALVAHADTTARLKSGDLTVEIAARAEANLIYHLDCLARLVTCTPEVYERLWQNQLSDRDHALIEEWKALRGAIRKQAESSDPTFPIKASIPVFGVKEDSRWNQLRWAEFAAPDADALQQVWATSTSAETAARFDEISDAFRARFAAWWREQEPMIATFASGIEGAMRKGRAAELLNAAARLYRADLGDRRVFVHLFPQPSAQRAHSRASRIGPHMTVEVVAGEKPEDRVDVIVHELAHHVFGSMPPKHKAALADALLASGPDGVPAWNLFDEVQATVIGNMLVGRNVMTPERYQRMLDTPKSFYADEAIDLGARATSQLFEQALAKGKTLPRSFAAEFVAALRKGLGGRLDTPAMHLRSMVVMVDGDNSPWPPKLRQFIRSWSVWTYTHLDEAKAIEKLEQYPGLSAVAFVTAEQIEKLTAASKALGVAANDLTRALGNSAGAVVVSRRSPQAYSFVFVARDDAKMEGLIAAFPACSLKAGTCMVIN